MNKLFPLSFAILFIFLAQSVLAKSENGFIQHFTITEGLSSNAVNVVFQDSRGFLWIGTEDGLNRYDGYHFKSFRYNYQNKNSISENRITAINEDSLGNVWVGHRNLGISVYNPLTGFFTHYSSDKGNEAALPEDMIRYIHVSPDGKVWIKTDNYLSLFDSDSHTFKSYRHFSNQMTKSGFSGYCVQSESDSTLLVGTKDGLMRFNIYNEEFTWYSNKSEKTHKRNFFVNDLLGISAREYLVATRDGLLQINADGHVVHIESSSHRADNVMALMLDEKGQIWVGSDNGVALYNATHFSYSTTLDWAKNYSVTSITEDVSGVIWIGTKFNGLIKFSGQQAKFSFFNDDAEGLSSLNVNSIFVENDSVVWLGCDDVGLLSFNYRLGKVLYSDKENFHSLGINSVNVISRISDDLTWLGTNIGLFQFDLKNRRILRPDFCKNKSFSSAFGNNEITAIVKDLKDRLWIGTLYGLFQINGKSIKSYFAVDGNHELLSDEINSLALDENGDVLIGTSNGVCYYDENLDKIRKIHCQEQAYSLDHQVITMSCDSKGRLWLGTYLGLLQMDRISSDSVSVSMMPGFDKEMITSVLVDISNRVWVSTNGGVAMLMADGGIRWFDEYDGLPGDLFNIGSVDVSPSGTIFFGGVNGLSWTHPDSIRFNTHLPVIEVTSAKVCNKGHCADVGSGLVRDLEIKYHPGMLLEMSMAALDFRQPSKNYFQIYLEGYDDGWRPPTLQNVASFTNLMPGDYVLKIRASNNDFVWSNDILEVPIKVKAPLWLSSYAYLFYAFIFIFLIQLFVNYRVRDYRKANRLLTEKNSDKQKLEEQQEILSKINQNLTDSINYANRIQRAMIPSTDTINGVLGDSFIYFRPRDVVSGDFSWVYTDQAKVFVAVVDCTGHGVPGAFMSIIGIDLLKSIIVGKGENDPARILNLVSIELAATLHSGLNDGLVDDNHVKDTMDISLCVIDHSVQKMFFAGAIHDLYLIRNNQMQIIKGDRYMIGRRLPNGAFPEFKTSVIDLTGNEVAYLFTDGFVDQFGGAEKKKFKYRRFRHLLLSLYSLPFGEQRQILHRKFEEWRGSEEQVDDILVLGFKPLTTKKLY
ncbi:ligand-binding sensor domain-containing protein [Geofilum sp. OHC36d9]|uniref:ligand-binding sensor domain-containing protein n=1 Tax=Geofilum sp. OHC36d9 TaxID=3458413 RepID=UPI0040336D66